jgi:hypothetical protein
METSGRLLWKNIECTRTSRLYLNIYWLLKKCSTLWKQFGIQWRSPRLWYSVVLIRVHQFVSHLWSRLLRRPVVRWVLDWRFHGVSELFSSQSQSQSQSKNSAWSGQSPTGSTRHGGRWLWWWKIWWNEDCQGKPKYSEKTRPRATLSTTNPTWPDPGIEPGPPRWEASD